MIADYRLPAFHLSKSCYLRPDVPNGSPDNYETTTDLMSGQHCDPLRMVMFNPETKDASHTSRLGLEGRSAVSA